MRPFFQKRLDDRFDKSVFFMISIGGIFLILGIRYGGDQFSDKAGISPYDWTALIVAIGLIILYGLYIWRTKDRSGVSVDRASDNLYYIGLLFTLTSLAYSLYKLPFVASGTTPGYDISGLLPDFGVALSSTIAGIFGRIILQQMRNDPLDTETQAREDLGTAIQGLRSAIGQIIADLNGLSAQTNLALGELGEKLSKTTQDMFHENTTLSQKISDEFQTVSAALNLQADEMVKLTSSSARQLSEVMQASRKEFEHMGSIPKQLTDKFSHWSDEITAATEKIEQSARLQADLSSELVNSVNVLKQVFAEDGLSKITGIVQDTEARFSAVNKKLEVNQEQLSDTLSAMSGHAQGLRGLSAELSAHGGQINASARSVDQASADYINELGRAVDLLRKETENS